MWTRPCKPHQSGRHVGGADGSLCKPASYQRGGFTHTFSATTGIGTGPQKCLHHHSDLVAMKSSFISALCRAYTAGKGNKTRASAALTAAAAVYMAAFLSQAPVIQPSPAHAHTHTRAHTHTHTHTLSPANYRAAHHAN